MDCHQHHHHIADSPMKFLAVSERFLLGLQVACLTTRPPQSNHEQKSEQTGPSMEVTGDEVGCRFEAFESGSRDVRSECECNHTDDRCHHPVTGCLVNIQGSGPLCASQ